MLGRASITASVLGFSIGPAAYRAKTSVALSPPPTCCLLRPRGISEFLGDAPQRRPPRSVCSNAQLIAPSQALVHTRPINQNPIMVVRKLEANLISSGHSPMLFLCSSLPTNENSFHGLRSPASSSEASEDGRRGGWGAASLSSFPLCTEDRWGKVVKCLCRFPLPLLCSTSVSRNSITCQALYWKPAKMSPPRGWKASFCCWDY